MSKEYRIYCEYCNVLLTNEDDIFGNNLGQLYHSTCMDINHGKSADCQPQILFKMNLKFADTPTLTTEAEGEYGIMELKKSTNAARQYAQQLEAKIKTLEDALRQTKSDGNKLTDCIETVENEKAVDKSPGDVNNITQDPKASTETSDEQQRNDTENVASTSEGQHTCTTLKEEKQEFLDLRWNCVLIQNPKRYCKSLDEAFYYVHELANEINAQIADNSVIHIDMEEDTRKWYVYFRDEDSKKEFLKNRFIHEHNQNTGDYLRIIDYNNYGIVDIANFQSSDLSLETAFVNVDGLAKKMGMANIRNYIDHIDVYSTEPNFLRYSVIFNSEHMKIVFLRNKNILKEFPETEFLEISDIGGHYTSNARINNVKRFSKAEAGANVIGVAELMGLSLSTDNFKRIYVLKTRNIYHINEDVHFSLVVEFSSNDLKNKFLKKKSELNQIENIWSSYIDISDIEKEGGNIVSIKYNTCFYMFVAMSFIGLAKQLGFSFTADQTDRFIQLSKFIWEASLQFY